MELSDTTKKYPSKYTDELVTSAVHIVEILMERKANKDGKKLTTKFWNLPQYKKQFNLNIIQVSALLNIYQEKAIIRALEREKWAWSVHPSAIKQAILEEEEKLELELKREPSTEIVIESHIDLPTSRPSFGSGKLGRLK